MYKVGQLIKNKRSKLQRRVQKISKGIINWISKDGSKKGKCSVASMSRWERGADNQ